MGIPSFTVSFNSELIFWNLKFRGVHNRKARIVVDETHAVYLKKFEKIRQTTWVEKWVDGKKSFGFGLSQFKDYLAGRIKRRVSPEKRAAMERGIDSDVLNSAQ
jgi:hypothetical protein